jgi:hypothetical protein
MSNLVQNSRQPLHSLASLPSEDFNDPRPLLTTPGDHVEDNMGKLSLTNDHEIYIGTSHWATILEDVSRLLTGFTQNLTMIFQIRCLKDELSDDSYPESIMSRGSTPFDADLMHGYTTPRISLLTNHGIPIPREQILATIPPKKVVDRHVSHFFNSFDLAPCKF